ncbi:MAG TPA: tetratricopeptide repeat protein [Gemmatimonadaceae bacterium]|nr:tetratricopeptide repeat protein [Gemmatimonadaceae bacterium]
MNTLETRGADWRPLTDLRLPADVSDLLARRLRLVHDRVARAAEGRSPRAAAELAVHFDRSGNNEKAYQYAMAAARRASDVYANAQAADFLGLAERNATTPAQLAQVRVRMAEVAEAAGRHEEAERLCTLALTWYESAAQSAAADRGRAVTLRRMRERLRGALGQPFRTTLGACLMLDEEAKALGLEQEHVELLLMISRTYSRLGDGAAAERIAEECVATAERLASEPGLLADCLNHLAITRDAARSAQAQELYRRALGIYEQLGDRRGRVKCHNNLGILFTRACEWAAAEREFEASLELSRAAGLAEFWGVGALNLGVVALHAGDHDRARDLLGEAFAVFATTKHKEYELYALFNLAHLERERGEYALAAEMYDVTSAAAAQLGQADVEIGALAGAGLSLLRGDRAANVGSAYAALRGAEERSRGRTPSWFHGRELVDALAVGVAAVDGRIEDAFARFDDALAAAEGNDQYCAAWLVAECGEALVPHRPAGVRTRVRHYAERVSALRHTGLSRRFARLLESADAAAAD